MQVESIPADLGDYLGISTAAAQVLLSVVVMLAVLLPVMYLSRGKESIIIEIVSIFVVMCLLVGIGWMPFWILIMAVAIVALLWARLGSDLVSGGG